jgi:hypothetical protein
MKLPNLWVWIQNHSDSYENEFKNLLHKPYEFLRREKECIENEAIAKNGRISKLQEIRLQIINTLLRKK